MNRRTSPRISRPALSRRWLGPGALTALVLFLTPLARSAEPVSGRVATRLRNAPTSATVLMVGAHPDDEDSGTLAELALRRGVRAVYLSLTRGEGGQNRIGPEKGRALGLLRTGELLAARRLDGAEQILGPFIDFGYSKTRAEAFSFWDRERLVAVLVQAIREVQPDVVLSIFNGTPSDGHGHHQACGAVMPEAFRLAGDPEAFPEQVERGVLPWSPRRLFFRERRRAETENAATAGDRPERVVVDVGRRDAVLGESPLQIALRGRSLHRSQDMGAAQPKGSRHAVYRLIDGDPLETPADDFLADLPDSLSALARSRLSPVAPRVVELLDAAEKHLRISWRRYHPAEPESTAATLLAALRALDDAATALQRRPASADLEQRSVVVAIEDRLRRKRDEVARLWADCVGLSLDGLAGTAELSPGESTSIEVTVWNRSERRRALTALEPVVLEGCEVTVDAQREFPVLLAPHGSATFRWSLAVDDPRAVDRALPAWLREAPAGHVYDLDPVLPSLAPRAPAILAVEASFAGESAAVALRAEVVHRRVDPGWGEVDEPLVLRPAVEVFVPSRVVVRTLSPRRASAEASRVDATRDAEKLTVVSARSNVERPLEGHLYLRLRAPQLPGEAGLLDLSDPFVLRREGARRDFEVPVPAGEVWAGPTSRHELRGGWRPIIATPDLAPRHWRSWQKISYRHIPPGWLPRAADLSWQAFEVDVARGLRVGYVPGAGDEIVTALETLDVVVDTIDLAMLRSGDLSHFDTIVLGIRALEVRDELLPHAERLWSYARGGGTIVCQYHKPRGDGPERFVPFPGVSMTRPAARVTDESAPVNLLAPEHPLLSHPNRIAERDFSGWVQERGLYFLSHWPETLQPLLESSDIGESPQRGGLLHGRLGEGHYVYCAYALFRQLPAGAPGAYRLLANLVSLPRADGG